MSTVDVLAVIQDAIAELPMRYAAPLDEARFNVAELIFCAQRAECMADVRYDDPKKKAAFDELRDALASCGK